MFLERTMMNKLNYFQLLCLFWAALGFGSRLFMSLLGERWNKWEMEKAYSAKKPGWLYAVGISGIALIGYTWFAVFTMEITYSWIIATLISLTAIKLYMLLFQYNKFRAFVVKILHNRKRMLLLNMTVLLFSAACIGMAVCLY